MRLRWALVCAVFATAQEPFARVHRRKDPERKLVARRQCLHPTDGALVPAPGEPVSTASRARHPYDLVVAMLTVRSNVMQQRALLTSWAFPGSRCSVLFVLICANRTLEASDRRAETRWVDTHVLELTVGMTETYSNLPSKVLGAFGWIAEHVSFKYLLKTDDDSFACVGGLLAALAPLPRRGLYWGKLRREGQRVLTSGKWRDDGFVHMLASPAYGVYAFGAGYALSADLVEAASARMLGVAPACQVEDGLVGAALLGLGPLTPIRAAGGAGGARAQPTSAPALRQNKDGLPPVMVRPAALWEPAPAAGPGAAARIERMENGDAPRGALLPAPNALGRWQPAARPDRTAADAYAVHLVNTSRIMDRSPKAAATQQLGTVALDKLCMRTAQKPSPFVGAPPRPLQGSSQQATQDAAGDEQDAGRRLADSYLASQAAGTGWRAGRGHAVGPAAWKQRSGQSYFLLIHRIQPWLIKRCAVDAGEFCTRY